MLLLAQSVTEYAATVLRSVHPGAILSRAGDLAAEHPLAAGLVVLGLLLLFRFTRPRR